MDFVTVCGIFGGSIFPEELRGEAHTWMENVEAFESSIEKDDPDAAAALSLLRAVNATLTYKHKEAQEILGILRRDAESGAVRSRWVVRSSTYAIYNMLYGLHPPHTLGLSAPPLFCEQSRYEMREAAPSSISSQLRYAKDSRRAASAEDRIVFDAMCLLFVIRTSLRGSHPDTDSVEALSWDFEDRILSLNIRIDEIDISISSKDIADEAGEQGMHAIVRLMERLHLEANFGMRQPLFAQCALAYHESLLEESDEIGLACAKMILADNMVAGPESHPLLMNFTPLEKDHGDCLDIAEHTASEPLVKESLFNDLRIRSTESETDELFTTIFDVSFVRKPYLLGPGDESERLRVRSQAAFNLYLDAERLFSKAGSRRGSSAIALRKVSIVLRLAMQPDCLLSGSEPYTVSLNKLKESAQEVVGLSGDMNQEKLLLVYHCLSAPFRLDLKLKVLNELATWGWDWGQDTFCLDFIVALGSLAYNCGHWYRYKCGIISRARRAYELAQVIFSNKHIFAAQKFEVTSSLFDLYVSVGLRRDARSELATLQKDLSMLIISQPETSGEAAKRDSFYFSTQVLRSLIKLASHDRITEKESHSLNKYLQLAEAYMASDREREEMKWMKDMKEIVTAKRLWIEQLEHGDINALQSFARKHLVIDVHPLITDEDGIWLGTDYVMEVMLIGRDVDALDSVKELIRQWIDMTIVVLESWMLPNLSPAEVAESTPQNNQSLSRLSPTRRRAAIQATTYCFRLSVLVKLWDVVERLGRIVEIWMPAYFSSVSCYTEDWPWRRYLWHGLVEEHHGRQEEALYSYSQSLQLFYETIKELDNERTRSMFNHTDASRISSSIARLCLYLQDGAFQLAKGSEIPHMAFNNPYINAERLADRNPACLRPGLPAVPRAIEILECVKARAPYEQQALHNIAVEHQSRFRRSLKMVSIYQELASLGSSRLPDEEIEFRRIESEAQDGVRFIIEHEKQESNIGTLPSVYQFDQMVQSIAPGTLILYTTSTDDGFGVFCIDAKGLCASRWDSESTSARFAVLVSAYLGQLEAFKEKAPVRTLTRLSFELSNVVVKPFEDLLQSYSRLVFVPSGHLSRFPLSALGVNSRYLIYDKVVWQIPSLGFQCHHYNNENPLPTPQAVSAIAKPGTLKAEVMPEGEPRLPMGGIETLIIGMFSGHRVLDAAKLSRDDFCEELSNSQMLHICTHGYIDAHRPLNSYISLKERLRIIDLAAVGSNAGVVIFSTCLSGAGNPHPNDDVVGFAHAILATGVKLFAGCLWKVNDVTTLLYTYFTYWLIRERGGYYGSFVDLWDFATRILLNLNVTGARNHLLNILSIWDSLDETGRKPNSFVRGGRQRLLDAIEDLTDKDGEPLLDFAHPYYWAPYSITGYADWKLMMASDETLTEIEKLKVVMEEESGREVTWSEAWAAFWEASDRAAEAQEE